MAKLIFKMRDVPDDEAEEVRKLLEDEQIEYFETSAGNWGVSMPALWLKDESQFSQARDLIDEYQLQRSERIKREYSESIESGEAKSMWNSFSENPIRFAAYMALISVVLFISLEFFLSL